MNTVYAFCRMTDDIVDDDSIPRQEKQNNLNEWRENLTRAMNKRSKIELLNHLKFYMDEFDIPSKPFYELIDGMEFDLVKNRYENFEELKEYCYKAASTVGLMSIPIFGYKNESTVDYAVNLGIALQLTNIIRDVKTDALRGRIYLPLEDLKKFEYTEEELFNFTYNDNFKQLMKFQARRAREFYKAADRYLSAEDRAPMFTARSMQYIYFRLLDKIEHEGYNVFKKKIRVSNLNKILITLLVWLKYRFFYNV